MKIAIRRQKILATLALAAFLSVSLNACTSEGDITGDVPEVTPNDAIAETSTEAVFYKTVEDCKADIEKKTAAYQSGQASEAPGITVDDCDAQMLAAKEEYEETAPEYSTLDDCQTDGVSCETVPTEDTHTYPSGYIYRPIYGGTYFYPYDPTPNFIYIYSGGVNRRVYMPSTVYRSNTAGKVVTPYGRTIPQSSIGGKVTVPRHTQFSAPARPSGTAGRGFLSGRSSTGFGSTFKATGRGGIGK